MFLRATSATLCATVALSVFSTAVAINIDWATSCGADPSTGNPEQLKAFQVPYALEEYQGKIGSYLCNVKLYCEAQLDPIGPDGASKNPRAKWAVTEAKDTLLSFHDPRMYPKVTSLADLTYLDPSGSLGNGITTAISDAASCNPPDRYRAVMNSSFNCAVWGTKNIIHTQVKDLLKDDKQFVDYLNVLDAKVTAKLKPSNQSSTKSTNDWCSPSQCQDFNASAGATLSQRLNNEATYQQCSYRYYLLYVDAVLKTRGAQMIGEKFSSYSGSVSESINTAIAGSGAMTVEMVPKIQDGLRAGIKTEDARVVRSYLASLAAFQEFARTYGAHIVLQLIERDYIRIRSAMDTLLTPITQAFYKATNAMSSKGTGKK